MKKNKVAIMPEIVKLSRQKKKSAHSQRLANCYDLIKFDKFPINHYDNTLILFE